LSWQPGQDATLTSRAATELLSRIDCDASPAAAELLPLVYDELRRLAAAYMRSERTDHTLQPTALVHEAYARLIGTSAPQFKDRAHFLGVAAKAMRRVLVDHARGHNAAKRGGAGAYAGGGRLWQRETLDEAIAAGESLGLQLLDLDGAMMKLAALDPRAARVVELRFFGGLTIQEAAAVLDVATSTVEDDWALARAWLGRELSSESKRA
jgi:RNA polymerase sigma factor (TIGR02999 family)